MHNEHTNTADIEVILSHRYDLGADLWTTHDRRLLKGSPFSCYDCANMLLELGMQPTESLMLEIADLFFSTWQKDGRFKLYRNGAMLPCTTTPAAQLLCRMGYVQDGTHTKNIQPSFGYTV